MVEHPNAVLGGTPIIFDFSRYSVLSAEIESFGFGGGEDGIAAGLDLIIGLEAGVRDIYVDWPWPFGDDNFGGFELIDLDEEISLITVNLQLPSYSVDLIDGVTLTAQLPQGADTEGESQGSNVVSGDGTSDTSFIELSADLDALLLELLGKIPEPNTQAVVKFLGETVFQEFEWDLGDYVSFIPHNKIELEFTFVDVELTAGLALTEEVTLDISPDEYPEWMTSEQWENTADVTVNLVSDNGTPDNPEDDVRTTTKLGYTATLPSPRTLFDQFGADTLEVPTFGTATITADYSIAQARFDHDIGLALTFGIEISLLKGALGGSWVPGFLEVEFGPLASIEFPDPEGDEDWDIGLGTLYSHGYDVNVDDFNTERALYEVFFVQPEIAPTSWDPALPGAEEAIYGYFEAIFEQQEKLFAEFSDDTFLNRPGSPPPVGVLNYNILNPGEKVFFGWTGATDNTVQINNTNGSVVMVAPAVRDSPTSPLIKSNLIFNASGDGSAVPFVSWNSPFANLLSEASWSGISSDIAYGYNDKVLVVADRGATNVRGEDLGDVLALYEGGTYYDGADNINGQHDVFLANFATLYPNEAIEWDLAAALGSGMGVTLAGAVDVYNVEAMVVITGNQNDYLVGGAKGDVMITLGGDDIVKNRYFVTDNGVNYVDQSDDYVSLGDGDDTALMELGNIPNQHSELFVDWVLGGTGLDNVFIRAGVQGLRYNAQLEFTTSTGDTILSTVSGANGIGSDAGHGSLAGLLDFAMRGIEDNYRVGDAAAGQSASTAVIPNTWISVQNGDTRQGEIRIARDVENVSIIIDENSADQGMGDDLLLFMGGTRYDGGVGGIDTFVADFEAYEFRLGTRNGLQLDASVDQSYFGQTVIDRIDRLHVHGTTVSDVISGGIYDDHIFGGDGDDFLSGGTDNAADLIHGEGGNDRFHWVDDGDDTIDGGDGIDTITIVADQVADGGGGSTSADYQHGGNHQYEFFNAAGQRLDVINENAGTDNVIAILDAMRDGLVASQTSFFRDSTLTFSNIEKVNIQASFDGNDAVIYQGGQVYDLGEAQLGNDRDLFIADFRGQEAGIEFSIGDRYETQTGQVLANGVFLSGMDRAIILAGDGNDILTGGWLNDAFIGGDGNDIFSGNGGNDTLSGGLGNDRFYYDGQGYDKIDGGTNPGGGSELDHLIIGGFTGYARIVLEDANGDDILTADRGMVRWDNSIEDFQNLVLNSLSADTVKYYVSTPGNPLAWYGKSLTHVEYTNVEVIDIAGTDDFDDVIVCQNGVGYVGGERDGDADVFVADLRAFSEDLDFTVNAGSGVGYDIGQGTEIADFERMHLLLGSGSDTFRGGDLTDVVYGGAGQDELSGGLGDDLMDGGAGEDLFDHVGGHDTISGGTGNDVLNVGNIVNPFSVRFLDAAQNQIGNSLDLSIRSVEMTDIANVYAMTGNVFTELSHGSNSVLFDGIEELVMSGSAGDDVLISGISQGVMFGGAGNDVLLGGNGNDFMSGGTGDDTYAMGANFGQDIIFGETGDANRIIFAAHTRSELAFAAEALDLVISAGADTLRVLGYFAPNFGSGLNFTFETTDQTFTETFAQSTAAATAPSFLGDGVTRLGTDADDDFYDHTAQSDLMRGFAGDDFFQSSAGADLLDGGAGRDAASYLRSPEAIDVDLAIFRGFGGDADGDLLVSIEHVDGSLFDDALKGTDFRNNLFGNDGNDTIDGRGGDDHLTGDEGDDMLLGSDGNDLMYGGDGRDTLLGGNDIDYLSGGADSDSLSGGNGADILDDGMGDDTANGGNGDDIFIYSDGLDLWSGDAGADTADFDLYGFAIRADIGTPGTFVQSNGETTFEGSSAPVFDLVRLTGFENIRGSLADDELTGSASANRIEGNLGNDIMVGGDGIDTISGGAGFDVVDYSQETGLLGIEVSMSASFNSFGIDTFGNRDVLAGVEGVIGTDLADRVTGTTGDNRIFGLGGDDAYLNGNSGNDLIDGGEGNDTLIGGNGDDTLVGGVGSDLIRAGDGDDLIVEGENTGSDTYYGMRDFDTISYATVTGAITVDLRLGQNQVTGAQVDSDTLYDIENIIGGLGNDTMTGNERSNWFSYFAGFDTFDGQEGDDTAVFKYFENAVDVDLERAIQARTQDADTITDGGTFRNIAQFANIEDVVGSHYGDRLMGDDSDNSLFGEAGADLIDGRGGNDIIMAGAGADRIMAQNNDGTNIYDGGDGIDILDYSQSTGFLDISLLTGDGDDAVVDIEWLIGSNFGDSMEGNAANNIFQTGTGDYDLVYAGDGDDLIIYTGGEDSFFGEGGSDTVDYSSFGFAIDANLDEQNAVYTSDTAQWNTGISRLITVIFDNDIENLIGTQFNDRLQGNAVDNQFNDGLGDDTVLGADGNDTFTYIGGVDDWDGGNGQDMANFANFRFAIDVALNAGLVRTSGTAVSTSGALSKIADLARIENVVGTQFDDDLRGNSQANILSGSNGNDKLNGGSGDDALVGGAGDDLIIGGLGADTNDGGDGDDTVTYADATSGITIDMKANTGFGSLAEGDSFFAIENVIGSSHDDMITGDSEANVLDGGLGDDTLNGGAGGDLFLYSGGVETWDGGDGQDTGDLSNYGSAIEIDLGGAMDTIRTRNASNVASGAWETVATLNHIEHFLATGYDDRIIGDALGNFLVAGAGDDYVAGGLSNDKLDGGDGDDTLVGGRGDDELYGGAGRDMASYADAEIGVVASLVNTSLNTRDAEGDSYFDVEDLGGSRYDDTLVGNEDANILMGDTGNDELNGGLGADTLIGGLGEDRMVGGQGADRMVGGQNGDFYIVDNIGDVVVEVAGDVGIDRVASGVSFDIRNIDIETLILGGSANTDGTGNDKNNYILGSLGNNVIRGGGGNDRIEAAGGDDTLYGDAGNDTLNGGPGSDIFYIVDAGDRVAESRRWDGVDHVISTVDFRMGTAHIETLKLEGTARLGAGNGLMNTITGNDADNLIDGGKNVDMLIGGLGNDTYLLRSPGDTAVELANEGIDTVRAFRSIELGANIENLYIQTLRNAAGEGVPGVNGIGNTLDNIIVGNPFDNFINGREGNDTLRGQGGADTFVFDRALAANNVDQIIDFNSSGSSEGDQLYLKQTVFAGVVKGTLNASQLALGTSAQDANDRFVFDQGAGQLWFDRDGSGAANADLVATFAGGATVTADDIFIF